LCDQYKQHWFDVMEKSSKGQFYSLFKTEFALDKYLIKLRPTDSKISCRLRMSNQ